MNLITKVFLHVDFEDLDVFILIKPIVDVDVKVTTVAHSFTLYHLFFVLVVGWKRHNLVSLF